MADNERQLISQDNNALESKTDGWICETPVKFTCVMSSLFEDASMQPLGVLSGTLGLVLDYRLTPVPLHHNYSLVDLGYICIAYDNGNMSEIKLFLFLLLTASVTSSLCKQ